MIKDRIGKLAIQFGKELVPEPIYIQAKIIFGPLFWKMVGGPKPPSGVKVRRVKKFQKAHGLNIFIETGTYMGDMVSAIRKDFQEIYSIELDKFLYECAKRKFLSFPNIHIIQGSSDWVLRNLIPHIKQQSIFWLDAHYSGGITASGNLKCPVVGELEAIQDHFIKNHAILIDDADDFIGKNGYPTLGEVQCYLRRINPEYKVEVKDNIIQAYVPNSIGANHCLLSNRFGFQRTT
jgi:hypothetical protein